MSTIIEYNHCEILLNDSNEDETFNLCQRDSYNYIAHLYEMKHNSLYDGYIQNEGHTKENLKII